MKKLIFATFALFMTAHSFACVEISVYGQLVKRKNVIVPLCPGDTVYKRPILGVMVNSFKEGKIISADEYGNVSLRLKTGEVIKSSFDKVFPIVKNGRRGSFKLGEKVFSRDREATIVALNTWNEHEEALVKYKDSGLVSFTSLNTLGKSYGCVDGFCIGDTVNRKNYYLRDAVVVGFNESIFGPVAMVKSVSSGKIKSEKISNLELLSKKL